MADAPPPIRVLVVDGLIGVGKSTLCRQLGELIGCPVVEEVADGNPLLALFYKDPTKYAFQMQLWIMLHRMQQWVEASATITYDASRPFDCVMDRSILSDVVFARLGHNQGFMTEDQFAQYSVSRSTFLSTTMSGMRQMRVTTAFLDASPEVCYSRMCSRARDAEKTVPLSYLTLLSAEYSAFLESKEFLDFSTLLRIDWTTFQDPARMLADLLC